MLETCFGKFHQRPDRWYFCLIVEGSFDATELNTRYVALPNTVPKAINNKYYEFSYRPEERRRGKNLHLKMNV